MVKKQKQAAENFSVLSQLGQSLGDLWTHRVSFFWLLLFSFILSYAVGAYQAFEFSAKLGIDKADLVNYTSFHNVVSDKVQHAFNNNQMHELGHELAKFSGSGTTPWLMVISAFIMSVVVYLSYGLLVEGKKQTNFFDGYFTSWRPFGLLLFNAASFVLIFGGAFAIGGAYMAQPLVGGFFTLLGIVLMLWIVPRLIFVHLNISVGQGFASIKKSWHETKGHINKMWLTLFGLFIIGLIANVIVEGVASFVLYLIIHFIDAMANEVLFYSHMFLKQFIAFCTSVWCVGFVARVWKGVANKA